MTIVQGPLFRKWLRGQNGAPLPKLQIDQVWRKLVEFDANTEPNPEEKDADFRPTLGRLVMHWTLSVVSGFIVSLSVPIATDRMTSSWVVSFSGIVVGLTAGLIARHSKRWRYFGTGLLSGTIVSVATLLVAAIRVKA